MPHPTNVLNTLALTAAIAIGLVGGTLSGRSAAAGTRDQGGSGTAGSIRDAGGILVPIRSYRRIVSLVPELDDAVLALGLGSRLVAVTAYGRTLGRDPHRLDSVPGTLGGSAVEDVAVWRPDLVLVAAFSDPGHKVALRRAGFTVFDCGAQDGAADTIRTLRQLGSLVGRPRVGERVAQRFVRRLASVADPALPRLRACYVSIMGGHLSGGTRGTAIADVIAAAGLDDAAAAAGFRGWPSYAMEDLVAMGPAVIITGRGMGRTLRDLPGAAALQAVRSGAVIEVDQRLLDSPGLALVDAAEAVVEARESRP